MSQRISTETSADGVAERPEEASTWRGRRKRRVRRLRNDLRLAAPLAAIVFCFALSATAIFATDWIPLPVDSISRSIVGASTPGLPAVSAPAPPLATRPAACDPLAEESPSLIPPADASAETD